MGLPVGSKGLHRNHIMSFSPPWAKVLVCKHVIHVFHLLSVGPLWKASLQNMSVFLVLEDFGAETSNWGWSWQTAAHGELGVTWRAEAVRDIRRRAARSSGILGGAILCEGEDEAKGPAQPGRVD